MTSGLLVVAPNGFGEAAKTLGGELCDLVRVAAVGLLAGLSGAGGMGGSDTAGADWGSAYDDAAHQVLAAAADVTRSCVRVAALLEQTGLNYAAADAVSAHFRSDPTPPVAPSAWRSHQVASFDDPPSALGPGTPVPSGWGLIGGLVGAIWPNGHQDRLHAAAQAWSRFGTQLAGLRDVIDPPVRTLLAERTPDMADAIIVIAEVGHQLARVARQAEEIADACTAYAHRLDEAHHAIIGELRDLLIQTAAIEAAAAALAVVTVGISEGAGQATEASAIARAATVVRALVADVAAWCRIAGNRLAVVYADAADVRTELAPIMAREPYVAEMSEPPVVRRIPAADRPAATAPMSSWAREAGVSAGDLDRDILDTWADPQTLASHVRRHGRDFGITSVREYVEQANAFYWRGMREGLPMKLDRDDRVVRIYDPESDTFAVYTLQGRTVTYFKPNQPGYWNRQKGEMP